MPDRWDDIAAIRRRQIEAGTDLTFCRLFLPYYKDVMRTLRPRSLLEVGCGTGHLASVLSTYPSTTVALEPSRGMRAVARDVLREKAVRLVPARIEEFVADAPFDMIISHLCAQVVGDLTSFFAGICRQMHEESRLVFSIPHPCFYNDYKRFIGLDEYMYMIAIGKTVSFTITKEPETPISGIPYHHRPLSGYFSTLRQQGFCVLDLHELYPSPEIEKEYGEIWKVPRYCVFHCVKSRMSKVDCQQNAPADADKPRR